MNQSQKSRANSSESPLLSNSGRYTPMEKLVLGLIKEHQPCTLRQIVAGGVKPKTASNILSRIKFIKRAPEMVARGEARRLLYWLDKEYEPVHQMALFKAKRTADLKERNTITQDPMLAAFFGMKITQCRAHF